MIGEMVRDNCHNGWFRVCEHELVMPHCQPCVDYWFAKHTVRQKLAIRLIKLAQSVCTHRWDYLEGEVISGEGDDINKYAVQCALCSKLAVRTAKQRLKGEVRND